MMSAACSSIAAALALLQTAITAVTVICTVIFFSSRHLESRLGTRLKPNCDRLLRVLLVFVVCYSLEAVLTNVAIGGSISGSDSVVHTMRHRIFERHGEASEGVGERAREGSVRGLGRIPCGRIRARKLFLAHTHWRKFYSN